MKIEFNISTPYLRAIIAVLLISIGAIAIQADVPATPKNPGHSANEIGGGTFQDPNCGFKPDTSLTFLGANGQGRTASQNDMKMRNIGGLGIFQITNGVDADFMYFNKDGIFLPGNGLYLQHIQHLGDPTKINEANQKALKLWNSNGNLIISKDQNSDQVHSLNEAIATIDETGVVNAQGFKINNNDLINIKLFCPSIDCPTGWQFAGAITSTGTIDCFDSNLNRVQEDMLGEAQLCYTIG